MNKHIFVILIILFSRSAFSENTSDEWTSLLKKCEVALIDGEMEKAKKAAVTLNRIDPSDTLIMYYLVLTSVELGQPVPKWLLEEPWPNAKAQDRENYKRAMAVIKGT